MKIGMHLPNYRDGSIVNLMASLEKAMGGKPLYRPLRLLPPREIAKHRNVVLIVVDGLGYDWLVNRAGGSTMALHTRGKITSVFPATTAAGVTTFCTGVAPQQHALTGWFMFVKELGCVTKILPFLPRTEGSFSEAKLDEVFNTKPFWRKIKRKSFAVIPKRFVSSEFSRATLGNRRGYKEKNVASFFEKVKGLVNVKGRKFIYAYWPDYDTVCHHDGPKSKKALNHFKKLDRRFAKFLKQIEGSDTLVLLSADHGMMAVERPIVLHEHKKLDECLTVPLCGEGRAAYCYVRPSKVAQFEKYVRMKLGKYCELYRSGTAMKRGWYGLFVPNSKLSDRIGDYILVMKKNYTIKDFLVGEDAHILKGHHGGVSREEMFVPLVVVKR